MKLVGYIILPVAESTVTPVGIGTLSPLTKYFLEGIELNCSASIRTPTKAVSS